MIFVCSSLAAVCTHYMRCTLFGNTRRQDTVSTNTDSERLKWWAVELLQAGKYKAATLLALHCYQQSFSTCKTEELLKVYCYLENTLFDKICINKRFNV